MSDLGDMSMLGIFRLEAEGQTQVLTAGLLALEREPHAAAQLEACMRAAHSLKGACRIVGLGAGIEVAHVMEDCFVAAQEGRTVLERERIDLLLAGVDLLGRMARTPEAEATRWAEADAEIHAYAAAVRRSLADRPAGEPEAAPVRESPERPGREEEREEEGESADRVLRITAKRLNRLLALTGESVVESRWLKPFASSLHRLKRLQRELDRTLDRASTADLLAEARRQVLECQEFLAGKLAELETFEHRSANLAHRLHGEALALRMRPFADGARGLERTARDLALALGKRARLELAGEATQVDRDILEQLEVPLAHLLRNALDHGIEPPEERHAAGKPEEAVIRIEARHSAGTLQVGVSDDGRGIDLARLRAAVEQRFLADSATAERLSEAELLEFLFLPGFTMKETVTEISGRGVGLDIVRNMVRKAGGTVRVRSEAGAGTVFQLQLPLTLSVIRSLLVEVGGEPYAFPLARVRRTLKLDASRTDSLEGRLHFDFEGRRVGLVAAHQVLGGEPGSAPGDLCVVVIGDAGSEYGLVVDRFLGERELVVQTLDPRLGKIQDIAAGALMEDGSPVLIVDPEDLVRSVEKLVSAGRLDAVRAGAGEEGARRKKILVVDDSLTVRELERKLLGNHGYEVVVAVDGMDGWNAARTERFDLVVTDVDMPRLDGIELVGLIKRDSLLRSVPVMIVSYKDREEDRRRGLEAGADYYLAKGSFQEEALLQAVIDLIGEAVS